MSLPKTHPRRAALILAALVIVGFILLGWRLSLNLRPGTALSLQEIIEPHLEKTEPVIREHIAMVRQRMQGIISSPTSTHSQRAGAFAEMGRVFLAYDYCEPAISSFQNAIALEPDEFRWHYYLSIATENHGQTAAATAPMATALKLMVNDATATPVDQHAALCRLGELALRLNKPAEARVTFELASQVNPRSPFALVKLGQLHSRAGDHRQAIALFDQAMSARSNQPAIRRLLAAEYRLSGNTAKAAEYAASDNFLQSAEAVAFPDPLYSAVRDLNRSGARQNRLGVRLLELGRYRQAMRYFIRGLQVDTNSPGLHINYAACLLALDQVAEGLAEIETARRLAPGADVPRAMLCSALAREPNTQERALVEALAWRDEQPGKPYPLRTLAEVQLRLGLFEDALQTNQEWEKSAPSEPGPRIGRSRALAALGRGLECRETLEAAAALFPDDQEIGTYLARLLVTYPDETVRDPAKALGLIGKILGATYSVTRAETMALALAETGQWDQALQVQREAVAHCGDDGDILVRRRLRGILDSLERGQPWREPWPFRESEQGEINASRN